MNAKVGVIGSGSWGTALVKMLCENLDQVYWCVKDDFTKGYIELNQHNPKYLSSVEFHLNQLIITSDLNEVVNNCDYLVFATPSIYLKELIDNAKPNLKDKFIISAIKGIIPQTLESVCDYFKNKLGVDKKNIGVVSGPCHAEEVALERQSYLTLAAYNEPIAEKISTFFNSDFIHTNISNDVMGIEYAAILKNIYSIACGIAYGMSFGDNFQAVLISNSIRELERFVQNTSPLENRNICESAYLGDLLVTGYSMFSRNRTLGNLIGKGYTVKSAILEMNMVAEGYYAVKGLMESEILIKEGVEMPIAQTVYNILHKEKEPKKAYKKLLDKLI